MVSPMSLSSLPEILPSSSVCISSMLSGPTVVVFLFVGRELGNVDRECGIAGRESGAVGRGLGNAGRELEDTSCEVGNISEGLGILAK